MHAFMPSFSFVKLSNDVDLTIQTSVLLFVVEKFRICDALDCKS